MKAEQKKLARATKYSDELSSSSAASGAYMNIHKLDVQANKNPEKKIHIYMVFSVKRNQPKPRKIVQFLMQTWRLKDGFLFLDKTQQEPESIFWRMERGEGREGWFYRGSRDVFKCSDEVAKFLVRFAYKFSTAGNFMQIFRTEKVGKCQCTNRLNMAVGIWH